MVKVEVDYFYTDESVVGYCDFNPIGSDKIEAGNNFAMNRNKTEIITRVFLLKKNHNN